MKSIYLRKTFVDFRVHYRVSRNLFLIILQDIFANLLSVGTGPYDAIEPPKQRLVCLWYLANMSSMRQVGHIFNPLKSSIHTVVIRVLEALQQLTQRVNKLITIFFLFYLNEKVNRVIRSQNQSMKNIYFETCQTAFDQYIEKQRHNRWKQSVSLEGLFRHS